MRQPLDRKTAFLGGILLAFLADGVKAECESGHWVRSVTPDGTIVVLEDGSVWEIDSPDSVMTMLWLPTTEIVVCGDRLINADDGEAVRAARIR